MNNYPYSLRQGAKFLGVADIADIVLSNPTFSICPGSSHPKSHHYETGGLARHTWEVWDMTYDVIDRYRQGYLYSPAPDNLPTEKEIFLACLFHDVGKMWDYQEVDGVWQSAPHKRVVHHISRSGIEWSRAVDKFPKYREIEESVLHAILAHHGRREWGSPVAPLSRLAWAVHLCDGLSARMDDADTLDITKVNK